MFFFPYLIAGPILRPAELLPQLHRPKRRLAVVGVFGIAIFSIGLLMKLVFADSLAEPVEAVLQPGAGEGLGKADYLLAIYSFAAQIYCDLSGYTDMVIGAALLLGLRLSTNFQRPSVAGAAQSVTPTAISGLLPAGRPFPGCKGGRRCVCKPAACS